jgi:hypothetical protein
MFIAMNYYDARQPKFALFLIQQRLWWLYPRSVLGRYSGDVVGAQPVEAISFSGLLLDYPRWGT